MLKIFLHRIRHGAACARLVAATARLKFLLSKQSFLFRQKAAGTLTTSSHAKTLIRWAIWPTFTAVAAVAALTLPQTITMPDLLSRAPLSAAISHWVCTEPDSGVYVAVLTTVAATAGLFLALYFTAVSVIASTSYTNVTSRMRDLVVREPLGSTYLNIVAHLAAVALFGLTLLGLKKAPSRLLLAYTSVLSAWVVFGFIPMGRRIFAFFDPHALSLTPQQEFAKWAKSATVEGRHWASPSFQRYFGENATRALDALEDLVAYAASSPGLRHEALSGLAVRMLGLMSYYAHQSYRIPSESLWFERVGKFERWELSTSTETQIALETGSIPAAETQPNHLFVAQRVCKIASKALGTLLPGKAVNESAKVVHEAAITARYLGSAFCLDEGLALLSALQEPLIEYLTEAPPLQEDALRAALSCLDGLGVTYLSLVLTASMSVETGVERKVREVARGLQAVTRSRLYAFAHPRQVLKELEAFHDRLGFEREVEGALLSRDWYVQEVVARMYARYVADLSREAISAARATFLTPTVRLVESKRPLLAAEVLRNGLEAVTKVGFRLDALHKIYEVLVSYAVTKEDWKLEDFGVMRSELSGLRTHLLTQMADLVPALAAYEQEGDLPDYLGFSRAMLSDELVKLMVSRNTANFDVLFLALFQAALHVIDRNVAQARGLSQIAYLNVAFDTALDLLDLSGLAFLFSELREPDFFTIVKAQWDKYLANHTDPTGAIRFFYQAQESRLRLPIFSASAMERQKWDRTFAEELVAAGFRADAYSYPRQAEEQARSRHRSRVIQSIHVHHSSMFREPFEYFTAFYFAARCEASTLQLPRGAEECLDAVKRERERREDMPSGEQELGCNA